MKDISPDQANILRGGAHVLFQRTGAVGYLDLGDLSDFSLSPQVDANERISGRDGTRTVMKRRVTIKSVEMSIKSGERTLENVRAWLRGGTASADSLAADSIVAGDSITLSECLVGVSVYTDIVAGRYYQFGDPDASKAPLMLLDPANAPVIGSLVEDTDYVVDYEAGMVAFKAAPGSDLAVTLKWLGYTASQGVEFAPMGAADIEGSAIVITNFEDGNVIEKLTLPKVVLEPAGGLQAQIENDSEIEFKMTWLKHATSGWGTLLRVDRRS